MGEDEEDVGWGRREEEEEERKVELKGKCREPRAARSKR